MFGKISENKISKIVDLAEEGIPLREIAEEVGVSVPTVSKYISENTKEKNTKVAKKIYRPVPEPPSPEPKEEIEGGLPHLNNAQEVREMEAYLAEEKARLGLGHR